MRARHVLILGGTLVLLAGCTAPDDSPVPTTAVAPWVCSGVPQEGVDLTLGGEATGEQQGAWEGDRTFSCSATRSEDAVVLISRGPVGTFIGGSNPESQLEYIQREPDAEPIEADATGEGYIVGTNEGKPTAAWVCGKFVVTVELIDVDTEGRDGRDDATNLLVSMLPWACDGQDVPS